MRRGDIYYVNFGNSGVGCEQTGSRPAVIIQNNVGNKHSTTVIMALITSQMYKAKLPTHVEVTTYESGLEHDSVILCEQIRTVDKLRLKHKCGTLSREKINELNNAIGISTGLITQWSSKQSIQNSSSTA